MTKLAELVKSTSQKISQSAKAMIAGATAVATFAVPVMAGTPQVKAEELLPPKDNTSYTINLSAKDLEKLQAKKETASVASQQPKTKYTIKINTTTFGSGVESLLPKDINYTADTRIAFMAKTAHGKFEFIGTNNNELKDGVNHYIAMYGFDVGKLRVIPGVRFDSKDVKEFDLVLATQIGENKYSTLFVRDAEGFTLVRPYFDGKNIDFASGHKWFADGSQDQDITVGVHRTDKNAGIWVGKKTNGENIATWTLDASYVHILGFGKQRKDGTGFAEMHLQLGEPQQIGGKYSADQGWAGIKLFNSPEPLVDSFQTYLAGAKNNHGLVAQIAYNKGIEGKYVQAQVGGHVGVLNIGGRDIPCALGGGIHYDITSKKVKPVLEGLVSIPIGKDTAINVEVRASQDDAMVSARTTIKF